MSSALRPGDRVVLHRPRALHGMIGEVLGSADGGVEVQVVGGGLPISVVVPPAKLRRIGDAPARQRVLGHEEPDPAGEPPRARPQRDPRARSAR